MQQGIGRAGYRLLALVFFAVGLLGLAVAWAATRIDVSPVFQAVGLLTAAVGQALLLLAFFAASLNPTETATAKPPAPKAARPAPHPSPRPSPSASLDFEYPDTQPAAKAAPEDLVLPKAFQDGPRADAPRDHEGLVTFEAVHKPEPRTPGHPLADARAADPPADQAPADPPHAGRPAPERRDPRAEMRERYTRNTPTLRAVLEEAPKTEAPVVRAERCPEDFDPDWIPDGKTRGRCGGCETLVLAPTARPIRLKCPQCGRVTLLA